MEVPESPPHEPVADMPTSILEPESGESGPVQTDGLDELMQQEAEKEKALNDRLDKRDKLIKEVWNQNAIIEKKKSFVEPNKRHRTKKSCDDAPRLDEDAKSLSLKDVASADGSSVDDAPAKRLAELEAHLVELRRQQTISTLGLKIFGVWVKFINALNLVVLMIEIWKRVWELNCCVKWMKTIRPTSGI